MPLVIRTASAADLPHMVDLLLQDAAQRHALNPKLWAIADDAHEQVEQALRLDLEAEAQPFRQPWLVAEDGRSLVGGVHSMMLPVPPIYAGRFGEPGLLLSNSFVAAAAPAGTREVLIDAAERSLREAGARIMLASLVAADDWRACVIERGYEPLTLYLARAGLDGGPVAADVRAATEHDLEGVAERSAESRAVLHALDEFWLPHPDAAARFHRWMQRSLGLTDRDMLVVGPPSSLNGYVIAQPASRLHIPPAHDITATGVIDDYFHRDFADPAAKRGGGTAAMALLRAAEAAFVHRGTETSIVVCPAAWTSKISILEEAGYTTALVWMIRR